MPSSLRRARRPVSDLEQRQQGVDRHRVAAADVVDLERRPAGVGRFGAPAAGGIGGGARSLPAAVHQRDRGPRGILDEGEVAQQLAARVDVERGAAQQRVGELPDRHVGPAPWSVDGEVAQHRDRQPEQVRVAVRHQFVGALGRRVEAHRMVDRIALRKRHLVIAAVDAGAAGEHQVSDAVMPAGFEDRRAALQVAVDVAERSGQRVAHAGLRGKVDHAAAGGGCRTAGRSRLRRRCPGARTRSPTATSRAAAPGGRTSAADRSSR